ncbi:MAG: gluconate 2-dehydrogenase subunit 3 family protein [Gemmatimonadota bacterium]|nr:gluconate 2-dehydrogenase subunit 3 family protein [Gemmatimonadota bacterium]
MVKRLDLPVVRDAVSAREEDPSPLPMDRRHAIKVMAIAAAAPGLTSCLRSEEVDELAVAPSQANNPKAAGTAWDPDLIAPTVPWERTLSSNELEALASICDIIIPADERSLSASRLGAHDFIDEWVSAPYDRNREDQVVIRGGLVWLDREAAERFGEGLRFRDLETAQKHAISDDICFLPNAASGYEAAARFFDRVRDLTAAAFWTTTEGMQDLQYLGNVPLARWDPPPAEVMRHVGLE